MSTERRANLNVMRVVVASWLLYATTFFPFMVPKEYLVQWLFTLVALVSILGICTLVLLRSRKWKVVSVLSALLLLAVYVVYWVSITTTARETYPGLTSPIALAHILEQGALIAAHLWGRGGKIAAAQVAYFEIIMPLMQILLLVWIAIDTRISRRAMERP